MEDGIYRKCDIKPSYSTTDLERTQEDVNYQDGKLRVIRYYGLVPREYLEQLENEDGEVVDLFPEDSAMDDYADLVEAIVVIADDAHLLKAEANPYMMKDRPIVAYQADSMPGRFWGRGTAEKGYNMQKAVDAQIRAHLDSLALTTAPMMAMDATRLPRGAKYEVKAGKNLLVNGNPNEIMMPFKFGNTDPANMQTAQTFQSMLLQATGTIDSASMPSQVAGGEASGAGLSMALSGLMKKNKRTLINFQEDFLIPFIQKAAWRFMQFDPERYPVQDFIFLPVSSMGMVAREYEQQQMVGLMQTLGNSPITPVLLQGIIKSSSLSNREEIIAQLQAMSQPDPMAQQNQMLDMAAKEALVQKAQADAAKSMAEAQQIGVETQYIPAEAQAKLLAAASKNTQDPMADEFEKRMKLADRLIKVEDIESNERIASIQNRNKVINM
jgi:predicted house-cleaning noncanonical NTP pyrophosphatase (MazG superfamily)